MSIIVIIIIAVNVLFSLKGFNDYNFFQRYKFQPAPIIQNKQYDRLLTSGFLHVDYIHLFLNMYVLYVFSGIVIQFFAGVMGDNPTMGTVMFVIIYLASIIGGNLLALFFQKNNPGYSAVGASGGVSGILFASIVVFPQMMLGIFFVIPMPAWLFAILYLGYSVYGVQKQLGNVGHEAHLGGAIVGLVAPIIFYPEIFSQNKCYILGMLVPIVVLLVMAIKARK